MRSFVLRFRRRLVAAALAGIASIFTVARAASPPVDVVLQLPYTPQFQFAGLYAAQARGYFLEEGIRLELRITNEERKSAISEVLSGRAGFGIAQGPQLVAARLQGRDLVVVAAIMQHSPLVLIARAADNIRTPHDLLGKRVALDQTSLVSEVRLMLEREGVNLNKITIVPNRWGVDEIQTGAADAMSTFVNDGPYELEKAGIRINVIRPIDYGIDFYGDCLFTTGATVRKNPALVEAVRRATIKGWHYALAHPDEMIDLIMRQPGERHHSMSRDELRNEAREVARLINADLVTVGHVNEGRFQVMADAILVADKNGKISRMDGFVYASPEDESNRYQWVLRWLRWGLVAVVFLGLLGVLANWRLRRLVDVRTRALQDAEHRQREIFDGAPAPIVHNDYSAILLHLGRLRADGVSDLKAHLERKPGLVREWYEMVRVIDANRLALEIAGAATVAEMDRKRRRNLTLDSIDGFPRELLAIWEGADHLRVEKSMVDVDGRRRDSLINWSAPLVDGRPDYSRAQLVYTDLTEIREAGRALRESEARFRRLFENSPLAIVEFDNTELVPWLNQRRAEGVVDLAAYFNEHPAARMDAIQRLPLLDANEATLKLLGASSKEELISRLREMFTENTIATRCDIIVRIWNGEFAMEGEIEARRLDGQLRLLAFNWRMESENGKPLLRRTQTLLVDVTEKRAAERALRESESRYRELFESAVGGIYRSTPEGEFIAVNPALVRMLGFESAQELMACELNQEARPFYVQPGRRKEFLSEITSADFVTNFESEVLCKNGGTIWISENVRVVRDGQGNALYFEGFVSDITKHRRLDEEMQRASKLEAVGILAGGIAHDFNNILTAVLGNIGLTEMVLKKEGQSSELLHEAKRAALRARDLTQQLLTFAKGGEPVRASVDLAEVLRETAAFALHGAKARAEFHVADDLWPVNADKGQLGQVVQNLVINSVQAMPEGGTIGVSADNRMVDTASGNLPLSPGRYVHLAVSDSGTGISAENLSRIFDPYFTTKKQGSGLGLATVYSIVKKHQGLIDVESQLGKGTTFHLWLPAANRAAPEKIAEVIVGIPLQARILFMDDEQPIRDIARAFMRRLNVECQLAVDGAEAVRKYQEALDADRPFDIVVMDLTVPGGIGGREAMELLQKIDPSVRAIVSSGYSQDPVMANHRAYGFRSVLPKPYDLGQLRHALEETMSVREEWASGI
jgi:PAS domain S-box-containing protein